MWVLIGGLILILALRFGLEVLFARHWPFIHMPMSRAERQANYQAQVYAAFPGFKTKYRKSALWWRHYAL